MLLVGKEILIIYAISYSYRQSFLKTLKTVGTKQDYPGTQKTF